ncbi:MAG: hypothetical protein D3926_21040 [Desulfobacteraceae bacterium]|nr:MAG: hypothetical protein D3926_21040 [Desulfobacteraceae bacterium]
MKKTITLTAVLVVLGLLAADSVLAGRIWNRHVSQGARIAQGVDTGELTAAETARLIATQRDIMRTRNRALADGVITRRERHVIEHKQDAASRQIARLKHNSRGR